MEKTDLNVIKNGSLMTLYFNEIRHQFVSPYACYIDPEFILLDDNARPHRAHSTNAYHECKTIFCLDRPVRSPDLIRLNMHGTVFNLPFQPDLCNQELYRNSRMHLLLNGD